ncbi:MAG: hypothetical protein FWD23_11930 [Oscillospiraceae bacterium]|nr:hypothetical protein [Oscillospiraceae bacterium]
MLRNNLLEEGYHFKMIEPKKAIINLIWATWFLLLMAPVILIYLVIYSGNTENIALPYIDFPIIVINIMFVAMPVIYLILKEILTSLFCAERNRNIEMKLHAATDMPINAQREAFKTWQLILIHSIPFIFVYPLLFIITVISGANVNLFIVEAVMSFLISFDLTLAVYILFAKTRHDANYIALNSHIYSFTLYSRNHEYIECEKYIDKIKNKLTNMSRTIEPPPKIKKIGGSVILAGLIVSFIINRFALPDDKIFGIASADPSDSYNITDAVRVSAYICNDNDAVYALERLKINEAGLMAPMTITEIEESGLYLEINGTREIIDRIEIISEDMVLSHTRVPYSGNITVFPVNVEAGKEYYLHILGYRDELSGYPRIMASLKLVVLESQIQPKENHSEYNTYSVSIELFSYNMTDTDRIMYDIDEDY